MWFFGMAPVSVVGSVAKTLGLSLGCCCRLLLAKLLLGFQLTFRLEVGIEVATLLMDMLVDIGVVRVLFTAAAGFDVEVYVACSSGVSIDWEITVRDVLLLLVTGCSYSLARDAVMGRLAHLSSCKV